MYANAVLTSLSVSLCVFCVSLSLARSRSRARTEVLAADIVFACVRMSSSGCNSSCIACFIAKSRKLQVNIGVSSESAAQIDYMWCTQHCNVLTWPRMTVASPQAQVSWKQKTCLADTSATPRAAGAGHFTWDFGVSRRHVTPDRSNGRKRRMAAVFEQGDTCA